jgi:hypothetical protein
MFDFSVRDAMFRAVNKSTLHRDGLVRIMHLARGRHLATPGLLN